MSERRIKTGTLLVNKLSGAFIFVISPKPLTRAFFSTQRPNWRIDSFAGVDASRIDLYELWKQNGWEIVA